MKTLRHIFFIKTNGQPTAAELAALKAAFAAAPTPKTP